MNGSSEISKPPSFGQWVCQLRKLRGWSRREVSERAGGIISQQYIHRIESGVAENIGSRKLQALAEGLGIPVEVLQNAINRQQMPQVPLLARAAAGPEADVSYAEYGQETIGWLPEAADVFAVEIIGDSMAPKIAHGDVAIARRFQPNEALLPGHVYLFAQGQRKTTCKYLMRSTHPNDPADAYYLTAERPDLFAPMRLTGKHRILGRVIEVRKTVSLAEQAFAATI